MKIEGLACVVPGLAALVFLAGCASGGRPYYISQYEAQTGLQPEGDPPAETQAIPLPDDLPVPIAIEPDEPCVVPYAWPAGSQTRHLERVLVSPARTETRLIPAEIDWEEEKVLLRPEREVLKVIPADFEWVDDAMAPEGRRKVVVRPAQTERIREPAEYRTVKKKIIRVPERREEVEVPAVYEEKEVEAAPGEVRMEDVPVVCPEDLTPALIQAVQAALLRLGYAPGTADGRWNPNTAGELKRFQTDRRLAPVGLSYPTLEALGIKS
jgi:hypothetical protein